MSDKKPKDKWYFKTYVFVIAILCVGPFALPLAWLNPRFSRKVKVAITLLVIILTYYLVVLSANTLKLLKDYYELLQQVY